MIDVIFPKRPPAPRERDARPVPSDYRPKQLRAIGNGGTDGDVYDSEEPDVLVEEPEINLRKLEDELTRNRLSEIATLVRALTYGEMMELARAIWKIRPDGTVDQQSLPMMLHLWSTAPHGVEPTAAMATDGKTAKAPRSGKTAEAKSAEGKLTDQ